MPTVRNVRWADLDAASADERTVPPIRPEALSERAPAPLDRVAGGLSPSGPGERFGEAAAAGMPRLLRPGAEGLTRAPGGPSGPGTKI